VITRFFNRGGRWWLLGLLPLAALAASCSPAGRSTTSGQVRVFVSIPPQAYLVEQLGGSRVHVDVLVSPGQSPHTFEPTPGQMAALAEAQLYCRVGLPFEDRLLKRLGASLPHLKVIDTTKGVTMIASDGHDADEPAGAPDPHTWLDPQRAKIQAGNVAAALIETDPSHRADYERNRAELDRTLDQLDARIAASLRPFRGQTFFVYHDAFGYFADAYGLRQVAIEIGGKEPGPKELSALIARARREKVRIIFVQPQFSRRSAEAIARAIGGAVVSIDDLARDYPAMLQGIADGLERAFADQPAGGSR
jgi:zinc transport system substrate-binding protein